MLKILTINAILQYIEDNLEKMPIDINGLVEYSGYSRRYLQLLFKENIGIPIGKYIQLRRVTRAAILLKFTHLNLVEISEKLFYDSQQTFTREFKKNSGYTPLQYRKNKTWIFNKMLGHREVNSNFPAPVICHLDQKKIYGNKISYKENIPSVNQLPQLKWDVIDPILSKIGDSIYISHKPEADKTDKRKIHVNAFVWNTNNDKSSSIGILQEGSYAYFSFKGCKKGYRKFIYNAYMNSMPFFGLQKKDSYDLEKITKLDDNNYHFEYFLPIDSDSQENI